MRRLPGERRAPGIFPRDGSGPYAYAAEPDVSGSHAAAGGGFLLAALELYGVCTCSARDRETTHRSALNPEQIAQPEPFAQDYFRELDLRPRQALLSRRQQPSCCLSPISLNRIAVLVDAAVVEDADIEIARRDPPPRLAQA